MATWTGVEAILSDGLPMRVFLAGHQGQLYQASVHDDVHPRTQAEFLWRLGPGLVWKHSPKDLEWAVQPVLDYFAGKQQTLEIPLYLRGTPFQIRVWEQLRRIPYGETLSYGELAELIGHPAAFRAVGNANGKNNQGLVIPCHRVLAAGGKLGGYTGGLGLKRRLLAHEAAVLQRSKLSLPTDLEESAGQARPINEQSARRNLCASGTRS